MPSRTSFALQDTPFNRKPSPMRFSNTNILRQLIKCHLGHKIFSLIKRLRVEKLQITVQCTANEISNAAQNISIVREPPAQKISKCYTLSIVCATIEGKPRNKPLERRSTRFIRRQSDPDSKRPEHFRF